MSTKFFTNKNGNTLIKQFEGVLENNPNITRLDSVVGFLRASGYFALRPFLDSVEKVRILIGIDVDKYIADAHNRGVIFFEDPEATKADYLAQYKLDIEHSKYAQKIEQGIFQMIDDLRSGKLELRAHPSKKIHAKIYILYPENFNEHTLDAAAITGSSNLSGSGLGISDNSQYEFNVMLRDNDDVSFAKAEFETLWEEAVNCPIEAADLQKNVDETYLGGDATPYEVYIKMLIEFFGDRIKGEDNADPFEMPEGYSKLEYQIDAVNEGYQKLLKYDGFILADVVGLGKTVVATMIAKRFLIENGLDHTKILVVYPPAVEENWKSTFHDFGIDKYTRFISNGSLDKVLDPDNYNFWNADEYDLVLVDEAHNFRNHATGAFQRLQEICKMPRIETGFIPGYKKKVMLITATPMNNTPMDIYHELLLFQDPRRCTIDGVTNLTSFFSPLDSEFRRLRRDPNYNLAEYKRLAERVRSRIIKPITVRRTRTDIESIPRYNKDIHGFPKVAKPRKEGYELNEHLAALFEETIEHLLKDLLYARYQAIAGLKPEVAQGKYDNAELVSRSLASIRKTGLVKRLESSFYSFKTSLERFTQANQNMIDMFAKGRVFIAPDLDLNAMYAKGMTDEEIEEKIDSKAEDNPKNAVFTPDDFKPEYLDELKADQAVLERMCADWASVTEADDSKYEKFAELLENELFNPDINAGHKIVVFSESFDTVEYLARRINRDDVIIISSLNRAQMFKTVRANFDANYKKQEDKYHIIITTDALAEGVNLHRSNIIINYDTPWNSTKLMQRIGRVNRIGSVSETIYNYVFYPSREGDREINLNRTALSKLQTFHTTFGEDNQIYSDAEIIDPDLDSLFEENVAATERDQELPFYEELRALYVNNRKEYNRISRMSQRSRTGRAQRTVEGNTISQETLVFLKTDLRKAFYRASDTKPEEVPTIEALTLFKATPDEPRVERIQQHHDQINKACAAFQQAINQERNNTENTSAVRGNLGVQVTTALSFVDVFLREIQDADTRILVSHLKSLAERGVITYIPKRLQRMHRQMTRGTLTKENAFDEIIDMAKKYNEYFLADEGQRNALEGDVSIILSESFQ